MKVAELEGIKLDYWVAKANILSGGYWEDIELRPYRPGCWTLHDRSDGMTFGWISADILDSLKIRRELNLCHDGLHFWPSADWQHGGPIIQHEEIDLLVHDDGIWDATIRPYGKKTVYGRGQTPLVAAMRAYVASKYGEEVPDE